MMATGPVRIYYNQDCDKIMYQTILPVTWYLYVMCVWVRSYGWETGLSGDKIILLYFVLLVLAVIVSKITTFNFCYNRVKLVGLDYGYITNSILLCCLVKKFVMVGCGWGCIQLTPSKIKLFLLWTHIIYSNRNFHPYIPVITNYVRNFTI